MFKNYNKIYFIGIGGIGMSSIALYFINYGKQVAGYDKTKNALTKKDCKEEGSFMGHCIGGSSHSTRISNGNFLKCSAGYCGFDLCNSS